MVEAMRYKPEGRGFDSRLCHWNFSLTSFRPHCGPRVDSASNRNEYQEYFLGCIGGRCVRLTTLPPSCADCLEFYEPQPPGPLRACPGLSWNCFTFTLPPYWMCYRAASIWYRRTQVLCSFDVRGINIPPEKKMVEWKGNLMAHGDAREEK